MTILKKISQTTFGFLVSEANDWRSRDEVEVAVTGTGGNEEYMLAGTILAAGATAADPVVAWTGSGDAIGILGQTTAVREDDEPVRVTAITRDAEVKGADLVYPEAASADAVAATLRKLGIIVRVNKGLKIGASGPGPAAST